MAETARTWWRPAWLFSRRVGVALLWLVLVIGIAVAVNIVGIRVVGGIDGWEHWLRAHTAHFFVWRLVVYAATAYGWWRMRVRLRREPGPETHQRLLRTEIAAVVTVVLLEASQLLRSG